MNAELIELRDSARKALGEAGLAASEDSTWALALDLGWLLVSLPEEQGGLGQGLAGACAFHAEFGRSVAGAPYLAAMLAVDAVAHSQLPAREGWLERLTTRELVTTPLAGSHFSVTREGGQLRLSGTAEAVPSADKAGHVLVAASDGSCIALVPCQQAGVEWLSRPTWDETRRLSELRIKDVAIDPALLLATGEAAQRLSRRIASYRDFALAADACGGAAAILEMTVDYLQTRRQFGRPLALFQALKHRCADLKMQVASAEALLADSLARCGEALDAASAEALALGAKSFACSVYARVAEEALQLHGGIGMTSEHSCHLYLKRALLNEQLGRGDYEAGIAAAFLARA